MFFQVTIFHRNLQNRKISQIFLSYQRLTFFLCKFWSDITLSGLCELPQKSWTRWGSSVLTFIGNRQTDKQTYKLKIYIYYKYLERIPGTTARVRLWLDQNYHNVFLKYVYINISITGKYIYIFNGKIYRYISIMGIYIYIPIMGKYIDL